MPRVCVALDFPDLASALRLVDVLDGMVSLFKVGLELFSAEGPDAVHALRDRGLDVFLDLKVNDIPKQAAGAVAAAARIGATYLTVHGNGGQEMVRTAVESTADGYPRILVVTILTSLDGDGLRDTGVRRTVSDQVDAMATLAATAQAPGLVLAPTEVARVRVAHPELFLVTPGIRPAAAERGDHRRVGTPAAAVAAGADLLVVGRPVYAATDPRAALTQILAEIDHATTGATR